MAHALNQEKKYKIKNNLIMENGINIYGLYEYQFKEGNNSFKWLHEQNYNEFVRKFKLDFPEADDAEIKFFTRTYFTLDFNKKGRDKGTFIFDNNKIPWYAFVGNYLKIFKHLMIMNMAG